MNKGRAKRKPRLLLAFSCICRSSCANPSFSEGFDDPVAPGYGADRLDQPYGGKVLQEPSTASVQAEASAAVHINEVTSCTSPRKACEDNSCDELVRGRDTPAGTATGAVGSGGHERHGEASNKPNANSVARPLASVACLHGCGSCAICRLAGETGIGSIPSAPAGNSRAPPAERDSAACKAADMRKPSVPAATSAAHAGFRSGSGALQQLQQSGTQPASSSATGAATAFLPTPFRLRTSSEQPSSHGRRPPKVSGVDSVASVALPATSSAGASSVASVRLGSRFSGASSVNGPIGTIGGGTSGTPSACGTPLVGAAGGAHRARRGRGLSFDVPGTAVGSGGDEYADGVLTGHSGMTGMGADRPHRGSTSSALLLMTPRDLLATVTGRGATPDRNEGLSTLGGDELSTVGSGASTAMYQLPLLGTRPSIMEEGGLGYADLMKGAAWRTAFGANVGDGMGMGGVGVGGLGLGFGLGAGVSGMGADASRVPHAAAADPALTFERLGSIPSGDLPQAPSLSSYAAGGRAGALQEAFGSHVACEGSLGARHTQPDGSQDGAAASAAELPRAPGCGLLKQQLSVGSPSDPTMGPLEAATSVDNPAAGHVLPFVAAASLGPFARLKSTSWGRARSAGKRISALSNLSHVPEEEPRSPSTAARESPLKGPSSVPSGSAQPLHSVDPGSGCASDTGDVALFCCASSAGGCPDALSAQLRRLSIGRCAKAPVVTPNPQLMLPDLNDDGNARGEHDLSSPFKVVNIHTAEDQQAAGAADFGAGCKDVVSEVLPPAQRLLTPGAPTGACPAPGAPEKEEATAAAAVAADGAGMQGGDAADRSLHLEGARLRLPRLQIPRRSESSLGNLVLLLDGDAQERESCGDNHSGAEAGAAAAAPDAAAVLPPRDPRGAPLAGYPSTAADSPQLLPRNASQGSAAPTPTPPVRSAAGSESGAPRAVHGGRTAPSGQDIPASIRAPRGSTGGAAITGAALIDAGWLGGTPRAGVMGATAHGFGFTGSPTVSGAWQSRLLNDNSGGVDYESGAFASAMGSPMQHGRQPSHLLQVTCPSEVALQKLIGSGCAGQVYRATWRGRMVAIKVITHSSAEAGSGIWQQEEQQVRKIEQEAALGICLDHPNIVATYAAFTKVTGPQAAPGAISRQGSTTGYGSQQATLQSALDRVAQLRISPYCSAPTAPPQQQQRSREAFQPQGSRAGAAAPAVSPAACFSPPRVSSFGAFPLSRQASRSRLSNAPTEELSQAAQDGRLLRGLSVGSAWGYGGGAAVGSSSVGRGVTHGSLSALAPAPSSGFMYTAAPASPATRGGGVGLFGDACPSAPAGGGMTTWQTFIVMELCPCGSLRAALDGKRLHDKRGAPKLHEVLPLAWEVACAMQYLHANGVVHGDLKAANVMLAAATPAPQEPDAAGSAPPSTGQLALGPGSQAATPKAQTTRPWPTYTAKVADFSHSYQVELKLRRIREEGSDGGAAAEASSSHAAPELFEEGSMPNLTSDIYSLGVVLWELYGGRKPYEKYRSPGEVLAAKRAVPTEQVLTLPDSWPPEYASLCRRCWLPPEQRPDLDSIVATLASLCSAHVPHVELCAPTTITADADLSELAPQFSVEVPVAPTDMCGGGAAAAGVAAAALPPPAACTMLVDPDSIAASALGTAAAAKASPGAVGAAGLCAAPQDSSSLPACPIESHLAGGAAGAGPQPPQHLAREALRPAACVDAEVLRDYVYGQPGAAVSGAGSVGGGAGLPGSIPLPPMPMLPPALMDRGAAADASTTMTICVPAPVGTPPLTLSDMGLEERTLLSAQPRAGPRPRLSEDQTGRPPDSARVVALSCNVSGSSTSAVLSPAATTAAPRHVSGTTFSSSCTSVPSAGTLVGAGVHTTHTGASSIAPVGKPGYGLLSEEDLAGAQPLPLPLSDLPFPWPSPHRAAAAAGLHGVSAVSAVRGAGGADDAMAAAQQRGSASSTEGGPAGSMGPGLGTAAGQPLADAGPVRAAFTTSRSRGSLGSGGNWPEHGPSPFSSSAAAALLSERSLGPGQGQGQTELPGAKGQRATSGEALDTGGGGYVWPRIGVPPGAAGSLPSGLAAAHASTASPGLLTGSGSSAGSTPTRHTRRTASAHHEAPSTRLEPLPEMESCHLHLRPEQVAPPLRGLSAAADSGGHGSGPHGGGGAGDGGSRGSGAFGDVSTFLDPGPMDASTSLLVEMLPPLHMAAARIPLPALRASAIAAGAAAAAAVAAPSSGDLGAAGCASTPSTHIPLAGDSERASSTLIMTPPAAHSGGVGGGYRRPSTLSEVPPSPGAAVMSYAPSDVSPHTHATSFDGPAAAFRRVDSAERLYRLMYYSGKFARFTSGQVGLAAELSGAGAAGRAGPQLRQCSSSLGTVGPELGGVREVHFYSNYTPPPAPSSPAPRGSAGGATGGGVSSVTPRAPLRATSHGHGSLLRGPDGSVGGPASGADAAAPRHHQHSLSGAIGDPFAGMYDSGSMYSINGANPYGSSPQAQASAAAAAGVPFLRRSHGLTQVASMGNMRQHMRKHSRMFTAEDLEAVLTSIPRFGDLPYGCATPTAYSDLSGFFSRSGDGV